MNHPDNRLLGHHFLNESAGYEVRRWELTPNAHTGGFNIGRDRRHQLRCIRRVVTKVELQVLRIFFILLRPRFLPSELRRSMQTLGHVLSVPSPKDFWSLLWLEKLMHPQNSFNTLMVHEAYPAIFRIMSTLSSAPHPLPNTAHKLSVWTAIRNYVMTLAPMRFTQPSIMMLVVGVASLPMENQHREACHINRWWWGVRS